MIEQLFFELIQVAIGTRICLSHTPSADEWGELYAMAKKQSLVGVCFAALQRLRSPIEPLEPRSIEPFDVLQTRWNMPEILYFTWMGMAAKIQQRNEVVNKQCVELCRKLDDEGFRSCILKGQGTGALYYEELRGLRQSGDIDVWAMPKDVRTLNGSKQLIIDYVHQNYPEENGAFIHIGYPLFNDTEVEMHFVPTFDGKPSVNRLFVQMFEKEQDACFTNVNDLGFAVLVPEVNVLFNLHHIMRHFLVSGIGLRHVLDLYFLMQEWDSNKTGQEEPLSRRTERLRVLIERCGMNRFFSGMLWVIEKVVDKESHRSVFEAQLGIPSNPILGKFILQEIMNGGNFGHHDKRLIGINQMSFCKRWLHNFSVSFERARFFPKEVFWLSAFRIRIGIWRKTGLEL